MRKKETETYEKIKALNEKKKEQQESERQRELKSSMAERSFREWLSKKETVESAALRISHTRTSEFNNIPFYPPSKTINFGH